MCFFAVNTLQDIFSFCQETERMDYAKQLLLTILTSKGKEIEERLRKTYIFFLAFSK